jgi:phospholipid/cholesterol/gamma-HCH transport system ATP-binding protein
MVASQVRVLPDRTAGNGAGGRQAVACLRDALNGALTSARTEVNRLSYARTSVRLTVGDGGDAVTLLLDRKPPEVTASAEPAEIELALTEEQAVEYAEGLLFLPGAVIGRTIVTRGPVRRFLEVEPILRGLLLAQNPDAHERESGSSRRRDGLLVVNPDLLAIETRDLRKAFGPHEILKGANLAIPEGVVSVVLGPSGTGKSVLLQHVIGLLRPDAGDILIRGRPLSAMSRSELLMLRTEIGVMFQDGALFSAMSVYDNVAFPLRQHTDLDESEVREAVMERLAAVGLTHAADRLPATLSGGMKKRAGLARSLVLQPSIVLCDEPDSGLDPVRTALLGELLAEQHAEIGGTMVVITHNVRLARNIGEHVSVLWQGEVLESGMLDDMLASENPFIRQFLAGESAGPLGMDA